MSKKIKKLLKYNNIKIFNLWFNWINKTYELKIFNYDKVLHIKKEKDLNKICDLINVLN